MSPVFELQLDRDSYRLDVESDERGRDSHELRRIDVSP